MSIPLMLLLSVVWGGIVVVAAAAIQRLGLSGRSRQMMWRAAGFMLLAPFPVALVYSFVGPEVIEPIWKMGEGEGPAIPVVIEEMPTMVTSTIQEGKKGFVLPFEMPTIILGLLGLGWLFRACRARYSAKELERLTRHSEPVLSHSVLNSAKFWSERLHLSRKTDFRLMPGDYSPFTQGVFKPVVYLPHGLERELSQEEMALVVGHELMHIRRLDAMWRPLERVIADVLWFNPFAWMVRAELDRAREIACDEAMLVSKAPAKTYARALVAAARFAEGLSPRAPAAAMFPFNKDKELTERVKIAVTQSKGSSFIGLLSLGLFLAAGLPLAAAQGAGGAKIRAPLPDFSETVVQSEKAKLTSGYGKRSHPLTGEVSLHKGIDIADKIGTPIYSPAKGVVTFVGTKPGYGRVVQIRFNEEWEGRFAQLNEALVEEGQAIMAGDVIAKMGESGNATGPHLHLEIMGPATDFSQTGNTVSYDPERLGVALIPALAPRAAQIRELGVVLPNKVSQPTRLTAPKAPQAPAAADAPAAPRVISGIVYDDNGGVNIYEDGQLIISFNPKQGNIVPRLLGYDGVSNPEKKYKYLYEEPNGDKVKIIAGTNDVDSDWLGIWVDGDKLWSVEEWHKWRAQIRKDIQENLERQVEISVEEKLERQFDTLEMMIEAEAADLESIIEAKAEAFEVSLKRKMNGQEARLKTNWSEGQTKIFKKQAKAMAAEQREIAREQAREASAQARAQARESARSQSYAWTGRKLAAEIQVEALEEAVTSLDEEIVSLENQCDEAEKSHSDSWRLEVAALESAIKNVKRSKNQLERQLENAKNTLEQY